MKKGLLLILLILSSICVYSQNDYPSDPYKAKIYTSDIDLFWNAFDKLIANPKENPFQKNYLDIGSKGLRDFIPNKRIVSAEALKKRVLQEREYYQNIRASSKKVSQYEKQIRSTYYALKYWYPEAKFPPVYFVIGRITAGGMASKNGLLIGLEVYSDKKYTTTYGRPSFDSDLIPFVVAHESIHFLQTKCEEEPSLLTEAIREGSAQFIGELIAGEKIIDVNLHTYGDKHELELYKEFLKHKDSKVNSTEFSKWLYGRTEKGRPQNLGYWIGYKIASSYFQKAKDKKKAI